MAGKKVGSIKRKKGYAYFVDGKGDVKEMSMTEMRSRRRKSRK